MLDYVASKTERAQTKRRRKILLYVCGGVLFGLIIAFFFVLRSGIFEVRNTQIPDMHSVSQYDVKTRIEDFFNSESAFTKWIFGKRNILTLNSKKISASLLEVFPSLQSADIKKNITSRSLSLLVNEREKAGVWCFGDDSTCVWFDAEGIAFLDDLHIEGNLFYQVIETTGRRVRLGEQVLPLYKLKELFNLYTFLENASWDTKKLLLEDVGMDEFKTPRIQGVPTIQFSLSNDPGYALEVVKKIKNTATEYIDLRVEGRVYYK